MRQFPGGLGWILTSFSRDRQSRGQLHWGTNADTDRLVFLCVCLCVFAIELDDSCINKSLHRDWKKKKKKRKKKKKLTLLISVRNCSLMHPRACIL